MNKSKHKTCHYAISSGELIVYVTPNCPQAMRIHGTLCTSNMRCRDCEGWRPKGEEHDKNNRSD